MREEGPKMTVSSIVNKWTVANSDQGNYATFVGFEKCVRSYSDTLDAAWNDLDIAAQADLMDMVIKLLEDQSSLSFEAGHQAEGELDQEYATP